MATLLCLWGLSCRVRDPPRGPAIGARISNHWAAREFQELCYFLHSSKTSFPVCVLNPSWLEAWRCKVGCPERMLQKKGNFSTPWVHALTLAWLFWPLSRVCSFQHHFTRSSCEWWSKVSQQYLMHSVSGARGSARLLISIASCSNLGPFSPPALLFLSLLSLSDLFPLLPDLKDSAFILAWLLALFPYRVSDVFVGPVKLSQGILFLRKCFVS